MGHCSKGVWVLAHVVSQVGMERSDVVSVELKGYVQQNRVAGLSGT